MVALNTWMNSPTSSLNDAGEIVQVDPPQVIFDLPFELQVGAHDHRALPGRQVPGGIGVGVAAARGDSR